ncbi:hypothetical protein VNI00_003740 [Paramarasmius palmivorus]|uniref:Uncharacterized protein n=1 Tax=Paramarasmius palmivorus TaxID=297713 RepID=A0AAW0DQ09_9AGAR
MVSTRSQASRPRTVSLLKNSSSNPKPPAKRQLSKSESELPKKKPRSRKSATEPDPNTDSSIVQRVAETGTIERGHVYFFYRPKVQKDEASSLDDVKNFHMLLVPRPPEFPAPNIPGSGTDSNTKQEENLDVELTVLKPGADAVPSEEPTNTSKKKYRLVTVGKKKLPDAKRGGAGKGRKETFWATVTKVGNNLDELESGLGEKTYETKTRGMSIVMGPDHANMYLLAPQLGDVQVSLGIRKASSFVLQVKNPLAPASLPGQASSKGPDYPPRIMKGIFGEGTKGRESYGLRFAPCETTELLDYEGAQLLFIAARDGEEGLESSLGNGRGHALGEHETKEGGESLDTVFKELALDVHVFPEDAIKGEWI